MEQEAPGRAGSRQGPAGNTIAVGANFSEEGLDLAHRHPGSGLPPIDLMITPYTALPGSNVTAGCSSFRSLASSTGGWEGRRTQPGARGGKLGSQTRLIQRRDNKPVMASGLTEPSAILESNRLPAAAFKSKQSFLWIFPINANLFCFAN